MNDQIIYMNDQIIYMTSIELFASRDDWIDLGACGTIFSFNQISWGLDAHNYKSHDDYLILLNLRSETTRTSMRIRYREVLDDMCVRVLLHCCALGLLVCLIRTVWCMWLTCKKNLQGLVDVDSEWRDEECQRVLPSVVISLRKQAFYKGNRLRLFVCLPRSWLLQSIGLPNRCNGTPEHSYADNRCLGKRQL
jgi:hypothetical protein